MPLGPVPGRAPTAPLRVGRKLHKAPRSGPSLCRRRRTCQEGVPKCAAVSAAVSSAACSRSRARSSSTCPRASSRTLIDAPSPAAIASWCSAQAICSATWAARCSACSASRSAHQPCAPGVRRRPALLLHGGSPLDAAGLPGLTRPRPERHGVRHRGRPVPTRQSPVLAGPPEPDAGDRAPSPRCRSLS
jgi:hypothetical protein